MANQEEVYLYNFECELCFLPWVVNSDHEIPAENMCSYCKNNIMNSKELLMRRLDVLDSTAICRFPEFLRHLLKHIELRDVPDE